MSMLKQVVRKGALVAFVLWAGGIFYFSSLPGPQIAELNVLTLSDKVLHLGAFLAGAVLLTLSLLWNSQVPRKRIPLVAGVVLALYGGFDELHQLFTANRSGADVADWVADMVGTVVGIYLTMIVVDWIRHLRASKTPPPHPGS
jgi:VanZ family protein